MNEDRRTLVRGWLLKASHDLAAARLLARQEPPLRDVAAYHCQQAAEKALMGFLANFDQTPVKTHDVGLLVEKAMEIEPVFGTWTDAADRLTPLATAYRYPGDADQPEAEDVDEALDDAETILRQVRAFLPREVHPEA